MIFGLFRKKPYSDEATALVSAITAQSRLRAFFLPPYGAPDTFEGRFEVTVVNAGLVLRRLTLAEPPGPDLAQALSNALFLVFDDALRETGVSDLGVHKHMKKLASAFSGRGVAYAQAASQGGSEQAARQGGSEQGDAALAEALARNVLGGQGDGAAFADYFRRAEAMLAETPVAVFLSGAAHFPAP
jgi:cytochrome b pre-mRNA-processing protein 3